MNEPVAEDFVGQLVLGRYRIVKLLGEGGMAAVYLARTEGAAGFVKPAVVKRMLPRFSAQPRIVTLFAREARIMANLHHPGIVGVIDFAEENGGYVLVLDYVHGYDLGQWGNYLQHCHRQFPVDFALHIVIAVLDALHYVHTLTGPDGETMDIVHRDVKPSNILIDSEGRARLADFGVARMTGDSTETSNSNQTMKGTLTFLAPELVDRGKPSPRSDLYACAVLLRMLLLSRNDFRADTYRSTLVRVLNFIPPPIAFEREGVTSGLDAALSKALSKSPDDRYESAKDFAEALRGERRLTGDEVARQVAATVAVDFFDPRMAEWAHTDELRDRERAWRVSPTSTGNTGRVDLVPAADLQDATSPAIGMQSKGAASGRNSRSDSNDDEPTAAPLPTASMESISAAHQLPTPRPRDRRLPTALGLVALLALPIGVVGYLVKRPPAGPTVSNTVDVIQGHVDREESDAGRAGPAQFVTAPAPANPATKPPVSPLPIKAPINAPKPRVTAAADTARNRLIGLTRAFAVHQQRVETCLAADNSSVSGTPEISVRFKVGKDGHVVQAEILPPVLATTDVGRCILDIARATEFGPQTDEVGFRIPLKIHSRETTEK